MGRRQHGTIDELKASLADNNKSRLFEGARKLAKASGGLVNSDPPQAGALQPREPVSFACAECQTLRTRVDEDGCCVSCGCTTTGVDYTGRVCFAPPADASPEHTPEPKERTLTEQLTLDTIAGGGCVHGAGCECSKIREQIRAQRDAAHAEIAALREALERAKKRLDHPPNASHGEMAKRNVDAWKFLHDALSSPLAGAEYAAKVKGLVDALKSERLCIGCLTDVPVKPRGTDLRLEDDQHGPDCRSLKARAALRAFGVTP